VSVSGSAASESLDGVYHIQADTWNRVWMYYENRILFSDARFDKWRAMAGVEPTASLTTCTAGTPVVCTFTGGVWQTAPSFTGDTQEIHIAGHEGLNGDHLATVMSNTSFSLPNPGGYAGATGGTVAAYFNAHSVWTGDETRPVVRVVHRFPTAVSYSARYLVLLFSFSTSSNAGTRVEPVHGYLSNLLMFKNVRLDLSGACGNEVTGAANTRGYCAIDALNNPEYLKQPVR
jgi:hypothetical protein